MTSLKDQAVELFFHRVVSVFGKRVKCIIGYGTSFAKAHLEHPQDVDAVLVFDTRKKNDLRSLKLLKEKQGIEIPFQFQILYQDEIITDGNLYSINTCGPFFLRVIQHGTLIYGENIFLKFKSPARISVLKSLLQKTQQYNYELKNFYLNTKPKILFSKRTHTLYKKRLRMHGIDSEFFFEKKDAYKMVLKNKEAIKFKQVLEKPYTSKMMDYKWILDAIEISSQFHAAMAKRLRSHEKKG